MNNHTLRVLEYKTILGRLTCHCRSIPGKKLAGNLHPQTDTRAAEQNLDLVSEMNEIFDFDGGPPGLEFDDLAEKLEQARSSGDVFEPKDLLEFASFFQTVYECQKIRIQFTNLHKILSGLVYPRNLHEEIERTVDLTGEIKDSASPALRQIRKELAVVKSRLNDKFEKYLRSSAADYLSDSLFTIRDGRFVLPVRETDKGRIKGIIHDRSSSGATFFIEPSETVEMNNQYRELETAEREEINRILRHLSDMLYVSFEAVRDDVIILARLDFIAACARLARELHACRPRFSENGVFSLVNARHPILLLKEADSDRGNVVPLNLRLAPDENIMMITGPNTGGKTVALKTVGLLSLMAASGLYVPADSKSEFVIFDKIFADIGDEQSIESSLSTYSSHLNHIRTALEEADSASLILFDELGAGTDPEEGAAMGQAVIEYIAEIRAYAVITTHQGKLKTLAGKVRGVVNGSMEFDRQNLRPTFVFQTGIPGSSYAVEIARKLGFAPRITERAWALLDQKERDLTRLIAELNQKSISLAEELKKVVSSRLSFESLSKIYEEKLAAFEKTQKEHRKKQLKESEELIKNARAELDRIIDSAREKSKDRETLRTIRRDISERLTATQQEIAKSEPPSEYEPARGLPGEKVRIRGIEADGEVLEPADSSGRVRVRVGNATMLTDLEKLMHRSGGEKKVSSISVKTDYAPSPGLEIDIRGMMFDEAEPVIERFLVDASNAGLENISIIHGKGTGALRKKVQTYLTGNSRVESYRLGNWNEGSSGVTVVTLKKE